LNRPKERAISNIRVPQAAGSKIIFQQHQTPKTRPSVKEPQRMEAIVTQPSPHKTVEDIQESLEHKIEFEKLALAQTQRMILGYDADNKWTQQLIKMADKSKAKIEAYESVLKDMEK
jgi:hypothetical protein